MQVRLRVPAVDDPDLIVEMAPGEIAVLRLIGTADTAAAGPLGALLEQLHGELIERASKEIVVDMRALDRMSASCLKLLLGWLDRLQSLAADARYKMRLRMNPSIAWQSHGLGAFSCFDTDLIAIET